MSRAMLCPASAPFASIGCQGVCRGRGSGYLLWLVPSIRPMACHGQATTLRNAPHRRPGGRRRLNRCGRCSAGANSAWSCSSNACQAALRWLLLGCGRSGPLSCSMAWPRDAHSPAWTNNCSSLAVATRSWALWVPRDSPKSRRTAEHSSNVAALNVNVPRKLGSRSSRCRLRARSRSKAGPPKVLSKRSAVMMRCRSPKRWRRRGYVGALVRSTASGLHARRRYLPERPAGKWPPPAA